MTCIFFDKNYRNTGFIVPLTTLVYLLIAASIRLLELCHMSYKGVFHLEKHMISKGMLVLYIFTILLSYKMGVKSSVYIGFLSFPCSLLIFGVFWSQVYKIEVVNNESKLQIFQKSIFWLYQAFRMSLFI